MRISLEAARVNKKLKQEEVGVALGVSKKTVSAWENGKSMPNADKIEGLCALYECTYDDIRWKA